MNDLRTFYHENGIINMGFLLFDFTKHSSNKSAYILLRRDIFKTSLKSP